MELTGLDLETLVGAAQQRNQQARLASGRLLRASATVTQIQFCEEWPGELRTLPACRNRASITAQTMLRIPQLTLARRPPAINSKPARWRTPRSREGASDGTAPADWLAPLPRHRRAGYRVFYQPP